MVKAVTAAAGIALAVLAAAGCHSSPSSSSSPASPHVSITAKAACAVQMAQWEQHTHFTELLTQLADDIRTLPLGSAPADRAATRQVTSALASDVLSAEKNAPPSCVPGFTTQYEAGLSSLLAANRGAQLGGAASVQEASGSLHAAGLYFQKASADLAKYAA